MTTKRTWKERVGKRLFAHVVESTKNGTLAEFKRNRDQQRELGIICWQCESIAKKLGL
jgi:hypothetical protein